MKNLKTIVCLILLTLPQLSSAQAAIIAMIFGDKVASENFNISMEIGVPFNSFSNLEHSKIKNGINFGIAGNIKFSDNWFLSPTVYFLSSRTTNLSSASLMSEDAYLNAIYQDVPATYKLNYTDVNVLVAYQPTGSNFRFGLSPQISFLGKARAEYEGSEGDFSQNIKSYTNKTDYGIIANLGYYLKAGNDGKGIIFNLRYYQGFTDVFKDSFAAGNNRSSYFAVHVSLPFITDALAQKNLDEVELEKK
ncbi:porin family protein [Formosa haliotis]|uniref:porin family protein n=1 Tax=Formosa haliotis TaxID=1555194 RepID=UPI000824E119|nr:porin family protein [Formosa haliotis]